MSKLTHLNEQGQAHMVDIGDKSHTKRVAIASGQIFMLENTLNVIINGDAKKGDVLGIARIAAIQASKKTADLIPLCHPISLTRVTIDFTIQQESLSVLCTATCETIGQTGVEMEALTAVTVGLLTIYDMCKAIDRGMRITAVQVQEKMGGKSGHWKAN